MLFALLPNPDFSKMLPLQLLLLVLLDAKLALLQLPTLANPP